jgi:pheromone a factor receptor
MDETLSSNMPTIGATMATLSALSLVIIIIPGVWHMQHRNIGGSSLVLWTALLLLMNLTNSLLWSTPDMSTWWSGAILCDLEVKLMAAGYVGQAGALTTIIRGLARVMNVNRVIAVPTKAIRRRIMAVDLALCLGLPLLMMPLHYVVQPTRYLLGGVTGCTLTIDNSLMGQLFFLGFVPLLNLISVYYSGESLALITLILSTSVKDRNLTIKSSPSTA